MNRRGDEIRDKIDRGVKQYRVAKELGCSPNTLSTWLKENRNARVGLSKRMRCEACFQGHRA